MLVDAILVLMQVGHENDWTDRGVPEVVTGYDRAPGPEAAGAEWMFDTHPGVVGDDWRLLVWTDVRGGSWHHEAPDAVVTPSLYRAAIADRGVQPRLRRPKLKPEPVTSKVRVDQIGLGDMVLVTQDRQNSAARESNGPWFVANRITDSCVAARVRGFTVTSGRDGDRITLSTGLGDIDQLLTSQPVIPVNED